MLVTLGEENGVKGLLSKVWDLEKVEKKSGVGMGTLVLLRSIKVQTRNDRIPYVVYIQLF